MGTINLFETYIILSLFLAGCKTYQLVNNTDTGKSFTIGCISGTDFKTREADLQKLQWRGLVTITSSNCNGKNDCFIEMDLHKNRRITVGQFLGFLNQNDTSLVRVLFINDKSQGADTLLKYHRNDEIINKFKVKSKVLSLLGRKKYVYQFGIFK